MSDNKVGIITFHHADNLGAVLQAYALQTVLESVCGVSAEVIDYRCDTVEATRYVKSNAGSVKDSLKAIPMMIYYWIKRRGFDKFRKEKLNMSRRAFTRETVTECGKDYDVFIAGSDQIWNLECSGNDDTYFLDFVPSNKKRYSYAASLGVYRYKTEEQNHIKHLLSQFEAVSVREKSTVSEMEKVGVNNALVHSDPVILLQEDQWRTIMSRRLLRSKYVFVYLIQQDVNVMKSARAYAKKHHCKLINNKKSIEFILHNSPADFLSWICYAECVFTNSFHGTAFSLIFNKPLAADIELANGGVNNRVKELLVSTKADSCVLNKATCEGSTANAADSLKEMGSHAIDYLTSIFKE